MATPIITSFTAYNLTDEEYLQGCILTNIQRMVIQNQISQVAEKRIAHVVNSAPDKLSKSLQEQAHLQGQLDALKYLLETSDASETALLKASQQNQ